MIEITIGDVSLRSDGRFLAIKASKQPEISIALKPEDVEKLEEFVAELSASQAQHRKDFRVPLIPEYGLSMQIEYHGVTIATLPVDISMSGAGVEFLEDPPDGFAMGSQCQVHMTFGEAQYDCIGIVKRLKARSCSLQFPEPKSAAETTARETLSQIVMQLQRKWMARRTKDK